MRDPDAPARQSPIPTATQAPRSAARARFAERLARGPALADGAMGTLLFSRGIPQRACLDELVLSRPDLVAAIHREYLEAGADLIETATFGANRTRLAGWGLAAQVGQINRRAGQLAREARDVAARDALVAGSVGPPDPPGRPRASELASRDLRAAFREQIDGLLEGGVDILILETFNQLDLVLLALQEARAAAGLPIIVSLTFGEELMLADGTAPEEAGAALLAAGVDAVGVNCGAGPVSSLEALARLTAAAPGLPGSIMPNAGLSRRVEGRFVYAADADWFAQSVPEALAAGARIVGGCCGTTPEHVAAMRVALDAAIRAGIGRSGDGDDPSTTTGRPATEDQVAGPAGRARPGVGSVALASAPDRTVGDAPPPTGLLERLRDGRYVISVEIDPPRSIRIERTLESARLLREAGVDCVNVSDSAMARVRMGALPVAFGIQRELGLECVVHLTTRDRNLMALEAELLGAHALGIRDILALTGDPPRVGDYPSATGVWDVDSIGLVEILARLNRGEDQAGAPIGQRAGFTIACALDPTSQEATREWDRLEAKLQAGAHLVMTQPLFGVDQVEAMLAEARRRFGPAGLPVPLVLGILPLQSSRHAEFLHHEVPGITIPEATRDAMRAAGDRGAEVGVDAALALLEAVGEEVAGVYVMPSFGRYEQAAELVRRLRAAQAANAGPTAPARPASRPALG